MSQNPTHSTPPSDETLEMDKIVEAVTNRVTARFEQVLEHAIHGRKAHAAAEAAPVAKPGVFMSRIGKMLEEAAEATKTPEVREAELKTQLAQAQREAEELRKNPALAMRKSAINEVSELIDDTIIDVTTAGAKARTEMRVIADNYREAAIMLKLGNRSTTAAEWRLLAELADQRDMAASPLSFLAKVPLLRGLARSEMNTAKMAIHRQNVFVGRMNRDREQMVGALAALLGNK